MNQPWVDEGIKYIGTKEIPGSKHSSVIMNWLTELKAWWKDDETPWCGVFVAHCMKKCGIQIPQLYMRASAWSEWGVQIKNPINGCIVTFERKGGGHVGFVVGESTDGFLLVLGGNQGNSVSIAKFDKTRVAQYRWPSGFEVPKTAILSKIASSSSVSTDEA